MATTRKAKPSPTPFDEALAARKVAAAERDLVSIMRRYNSRAKGLEEAAAERDRLVRDAYAAKVPRARIAEITGLSPQRIDQIRRGARL